MTPKEFASQLKTMPRYAFPGGYTVLVWTQDGPVCPVCWKNRARQFEMFQALRQRHPWNPQPHAFDVYWEGPPETCVFCDAALPSEYGDPEEPELSEKEACAS